MDNDGFTRAVLPGAGRIARLAVLCAVALSSGMGPLPARAQWSESNRAKALSDCVPSCERTAAPSVRHVCPRYCECSVKEAEGRYPDFDVLDRAARTNNPDISAVVQEIARLCAQRAMQR